MTFLRYADSSIMYWLRVALSVDAKQAEVSPRVLYRALELYYLNNGVYDLVQQYLYENSIWTEGMKGLRNPAHRVVEFYVSHLWPGKLPESLPIVADNARIVEPIQQIWKWSNWSAQKQVSSRWVAEFGDLFIKVPTRNDPLTGKPKRVYLQPIKSEYVTDIEHDERGFLTYIRLDIPQVRDEGGQSVLKVHTEEWSKDTGLTSTWLHDQSPETPIKLLGDPQSTREIAEFGIDFVPFVHAKFQDIGEDRGIGAFVHALDKIDEANRQATRLHQILFRYNKPLWASSAGGNDNTGRPLPPPRLGNNPSSRESETIDIGDDTVIGLPGNSTLNPLIPNLQYDAALKILQDHMLELEHDLPELAYYRIRDQKSDLSGRAIRLMLSDAVDKAVEARGNAEDALARAHAMALTIGQSAGLFSNLGTFENGDFEHSFAERPIIALSELEEAEIIKAETDAGIPLRIALKRRGWTDERIAELEAAKQEERDQQAETLGQAVLNAGRNFDNGRNPPRNNNQEEE